MATKNYVSKADTGNPVEVPCNEIFWDKTWNARREKSLSSDSENGVATSVAGYPALVCSLATGKLNGEAFPQRDPCTVRPNPDFGKKKGLPGRRFLGVAGFQRAEAIENTAAGNQDEVTILTNPKQGGFTQADVLTLKNADPTIRVYIKNLTEAQARAENLAENMQRSTLSGPDIANGVKLLHEADPAMSATQMAIVLGNNQSFVSKLIRITDGTKDAIIPAGKLNPGSRPVTILEAWREASKQVTQNEMDAIAKLEPEKRVPAYLAAIGKGTPVAGGPKPKPKGAHGPGSWLTNAIQRDAPTVGLMLGTLQRLGVMQPLGRLTDEAIRTLYSPFRQIPIDAEIKGDSENTGSHSMNMARLADAIHAGIKVGLAEPVISNNKESTDKQIAVQQQAALDKIVPTKPAKPAKKGDGRVARRVEN